MVKSFKNQRVLVLGLGLHGGGVAVARFLARQGAQVTVSDKKNKSELALSLDKLKNLSIKYVLGEHPESLLGDCDLIIQNPGVPADLSLLNQARQQKIPIENEASLFFKLCPSNLIIGVTGSRGKSTTSTILGSILKLWQKDTQVAGNIRDQLMFDVLPKIKKHTPVVLELSSWHLEVMGEHKIRVLSALITNIYPEHLNRYKSFAAYRSAKEQIFKWQKRNDNLVLNYDNKYTRQFGKKAIAKVWWWSIKNKVSRGCFVKNNTVYFKNKSKVVSLFNLSDIKLLGEHNLANVLSAVTLARVIGVPIDYIKLGIKNFVGLHDRLELIAEIKKVSYYNDTSATSPEAVIAALNALSARPIILIAGGVDKNLNYKELAEVIKKRVKQLILLPGTASDKIKQSLGGVYKFKTVSSMLQAVTLAKKLARVGDIILLSPGAASFNLFKHEFDRGEQFKKVVFKLKK